MLLNILIKYQPDNIINLQNGDGETVLHLATYNSCVPVLKYLMKAKADPSIQDVNGNTPLHISISEINTHSFQILHYLLDGNKDVKTYIDKKNIGKFVKAKWKFILISTVWPMIDFDIGVTRLKMLVLETIF